MEDGAAAALAGPAGAGPAGGLGDGLAGQLAARPRPRAGWFRAARAAGSGAGAVAEPVRGPRAVPGGRVGPAGVGRGSLGARHRVGRARTSSGRPVRSPRLLGAHRAASGRRLGGPGGARVHRVCRARGGAVRVAVRFSAPRTGAGGRRAAARGAGGGPRAGADQWSAGGSDRADRPGRADRTVVGAAVHGVRGRGAGGGSRARRGPGGRGPFGAGAAEPVLRRPVVDLRGLRVVPLVAAGQGRPPRPGKMTP